MKKVVLFPAYFSTFGQTTETVQCPVIETEDVTIDGTTVTVIKTLTQNLGNSNEPPSVSMQRFFPF